MAMRMLQCRGCTATKRDTGKKDAGLWGRSHNACLGLLSILQRVQAHRHFLVTFSSKAMCTCLLLPHTAQALVTCLVFTRFVYKPVTSWQSAGTRMTLDSCKIHANTCHFGDHCGHTPFTFPSHNECTHFSHPRTALTYTLIQSITRHMYPPWTSSHSADSTI